MLFLILVSIIIIGTPVVYFILQGISCYNCGKIVRVIFVCAPISIILIFACVKWENSPLIPPSIDYEWELLELTPGQPFIAPSGNLKIYDPAALSSHAKEIAPHCMINPRDRVCLQ